MYIVDGDSEVVTHYEKVLPELGLSPGDIDLIVFLRQQAWG